MGVDADHSSIRGVSDTPEPQPWARRHPSGRTSWASGSSCATGSPTAPRPTSSACARRGARTSLTVDRDGPRPGHHRPRRRGHRQAGAAACLGPGAGRGAGGRAAHRRAVVDDLDRAARRLAAARLSPARRPAAPAGQLGAGDARARHRLGGRGLRRTPVLRRARPDADASRCSAGPWSRRAAPARLRLHRRRRRPRPARVRRPGPAVRARGRSRRTRDARGVAARGHRVAGGRGSVGRGVLSGDWLLLESAGGRPGATVAAASRPPSSPSSSTGVPRSARPPRCCTWRSSTTARSRSTSGTGSSPTTPTATSSALTGGWRRTAARPRAVPAATAGAGARRTTHAGEDHAGEVDAELGGEPRISDGAQVPSARARLPAAGTVVTEMKTPTIALARAVDRASTPAAPAISATMNDHRSGCQMKPVCGRGRVTISAVTRPVRSATRHSRATTTRRDTTSPAPAGAAASTEAEPAEAPGRWRSRRPCRTPARPPSRR